MIGYKPSGQDGQKKDWIHHSKYSTGEDVTDRNRMNKCLNFIIKSPGMCGKESLNKKITMETFSKRANGNINCIGEFYIIFPLRRDVTFSSSSAFSIY